MPRSRVDPSLTPNSEGQFKLYVCSYHSPVLGRNVIRLKWIPRHYWSDPRNVNRTIYMLPNQNLIQSLLSMNDGYLVVMTTTYTKDQLTWDMVINREMTNRLRLKSQLTPFNRMWQNRLLTRYWQICTDEQAGPILDRMTVTNVRYQCLFRREDLGQYTLVRKLFDTRDVERYVSFDRVDYRADSFWLVYLLPPLWQLNHIWTFESIT